MKYLLETDDWPSVADPYLSNTELLKQIAADRAAQDSDTEPEDRRLPTRKATT